MPYLTEADRKKIRAVADNYLRYARRQRNKALTKKYPRDMVLQKTFSMSSSVRHGDMQSMSPSAHS